MSRCTSKHLGIRLKNREQKFILYFNFKNLQESLIAILALPFSLVGSFWLLGYNLSLIVLPVIYYLWKSREVKRLTGSSNENPR